jgi:cytochrome c oxidase subunit 4
MNRRLNDIDARRHPGYQDVLIVWLGLLALTGATVTATALELGGLAVAAAIVIAFVKSSLVVDVFMNIGKEPKIFKIMLGVALVTLAVIMALTFVDVIFR